MTSSPKTLMLVGAHHDDNEGNAAGLMVRHRKAGWRVVSVVMTNGRWSRGAMSDETIAVRNQESIDAAAVLDVETVFMGYDEGGFRATAEACDAMVEQMLQIRPDIIMTHPPRDYHIDHINTSQCVLEAWYLCPIGAATSGNPFSPALYYYDAVCVPFEPDVFVDITDYSDIKAQAQYCHKSQIPLEGPGDGDIVDLARSRARYRGFESGVTYAEAFRFMPKPGMVRMAELLG
jgi:LmbE family N-acetylglucosaminyl deacetylase